MTSALVCEVARHAAERLLECPGIEELDGREPSRLVEPEDHAAAPGQVRKGAQRGGQRLRKAPSGRLDLDGRGVSFGSAEGGDEIVDVERPGR